MGPRASQDLRSPSPIMAPDMTQNKKFIVLAFLEAAERKSKRN